MRRTSARERQGLIAWYGKMVVCLNSLPPDERADFDKWDKERTGETATSDWPGFARYLPPRPLPRIKVS